MSFRDSDQLPADWLRVLHWNVHSWLNPTSDASNLDAVADVVRETDPGVVSLVEVDETWGLSLSVAELAARCGYSWLFAPTFEYGGEAPVGGFGNALLSRLPILAVQQRQLVWPPRLYDGAEPSEPRSVVLAKVGISGMEAVWTGSTHLPRTDAAARGAALDQLSAIARSLDGPWMICGDFNTPAYSWRNTTFTVAPDPPQPTYPADQPIECIDYCIARPNSHVEADVLPASGSDHRPVLFRLRRGECGESCTL